MPKEKIIINDDNPRRLEQIFYPELRSLRTERFSYKLKAMDDKACFDLTSKDETGKKIIKSSIDRLLTIYQKMLGLSEVQDAKCQSGNTGKNK
ncbi:MAG: hypothetical protein ACLFPQ_04750 [Candidatus Woesearchaeota archaeon]